MTRNDPSAVEERLKELFPSCETDCTDGCKYGCLGWLHRFDPESPLSTPATGETANDEGIET